MVNVDHASSTRPSLAGRGMSLAAKVVVRGPQLLAPLLPDRAGARLARAVLLVACAAGSAPTLPHKAIDVAGPRGRLRGEWVGAVPEPGRPVLYFLHGSGYVGCTPGTHRGLVSELSRRLDRAAFSLDYRRAPEYRFPAAHDDTLNGYLWLRARGHAAEDIVVMGDSAGGHLALGLCVQLRELGLEQPRAVVGFSALVDSTWALAKEREPHVDDAFMRVRAARKLTELYTGSDHFADPRLNVLSAVGPDLPPILLQAGAAEVLSADSEAYGAALLAAGGDCEVQTWPGMFHVFQLPYLLLPEAKDALDNVERFVARVESESTRKPKSA
ncbi:alpha/beta hydrolase [Nocardia nepalensis]|uniref:alpha/beta hydrolase n=1 Tax=Nocardia nepalensis TaxID=3375448 RepID=UPI003B681E8F